MTWLSQDYYNELDKYNNKLKRREKIGDIVVYSVLTIYLLTLCVGAILLIST